QASQGIGVLRLLRASRRGCGRRQGQGEERNPKAVGSGQHQHLQNELRSRVQRREPGTLEPETAAFSALALRLQFVVFSSFRRRKRGGSVAATLQSARGRSSWGGCRRE